MGLKLRGDPVKQHDFLNLLILPFVGFASLFSTITGHFTVGTVVIRTLICYMAADALHIALTPKSVPSAKLVLFHHFVSVLGLYHGIKFPSAVTFVASFGIIEIHTSFMTFRRLTGIRSKFSEFWFHVITILVRLVFIPALAVMGVKNLWDLGVLWKLDGVPGLTAISGLSIFNVQFLIKRKAMFNYAAKATSAAAAATEKVK